MSGYYFKVWRLLLVASICYGCNLSKALALEPVASSIVDYCPQFAQQGAENFWQGYSINQHQLNPLGEVRWVAPNANAELGQIECSYQVLQPRQATPTLISKFKALRPLTKGWQPPGPNYDWLLCSGATMVYFDRFQCPFYRLNLL